MRGLALAIRANTVKTVKKRKGEGKSGCARLVYVLGVVKKY